MARLYQAADAYVSAYRAEGFNIPNHPSFGNPNVTFGNANFGTVTQMAGSYTPRQIQFALKLLF